MAKKQNTNEEKTLNEQLRERLAEKAAENEELRASGKGVPVGQRRTKTVADAKKRPNASMKRKGVAYKTDVEPITDIPTKLAEDNSDLVFKGSYATKSKGHAGIKMVADSETTNRLTALALALVDLPPIDLTDAKQVEQRCRDYFQIEFDYQDRPTTEGLACALGIERCTLLNWITGRVSKKPEVVAVLKKYHGLLNNLMASYMTNNVISPVSGIFLMKNNYKLYEDKSIVDVTVNNTPQSAEALESRYLESIAELQASDPEEEQK